MRASNNINQLLSHVKSIFGRKATQAAITPPEAEPPTGITVICDPRLSAAFADIEKYLVDNYGTLPAKLQYKDYTNGTSLTSGDANFAVSLVILTTTNGAAHLPDNVLLLGGVTSTKDKDWLSEELVKFIVFLKELGATHRIQHLAFAFSKDSSACRLRSKNPYNPAIVQSADVTCVRLY